MLIKHTCFKCTIQRILVYSQSCTAFTADDRIIFITLQRKIIPISRLCPILLSPQLCKTMNLLLYISMELPILDISLKSNDTIYNHLCLAPFTLDNVFKVHPYCNVNQYYIPFNGWIIFYYMDIPHFLSIRQLMDIWIISTFWLLWILLLFIKAIQVIFSFFCGHLF